MIDEGYSMNLYCDHPKHDPSVIYNYDWQYGFSGKNKTECIKEAKIIGWKFKKDGKVICSYCAKLKDKKDKKEDKVTEHIKDWSKV